MARYTASDVAAHVVQRYIDKGHPISNLQLQKILYFLQCHWLEKYRTPLFDDDFEAWQYGPVVRDVYRTYAVFGGTPIFKVMEYDSPSLLGEFGQRIKKIDCDVASEIDRVADQYACKRPWELVNLAHREDGAWFQVYDGGKGRFDCIPKELIRELECN